MKYNDMEFEKYRCCRDCNIIVRIDQGVVHCDDCNICTEGIFEVKVK